MAQQPMYQHIADELRHQIESGSLECGKQLPTQTELCAEYCVSRNTIRDAIKRLTALGLVEARPGQGTYVKMNLDPFVTLLSPYSDSIDPEGARYRAEVNRQHRTARVTGPRVAVEVPRAEILRLLWLPPGTPVVSRHRERYIDEVPWSLQASFYPLEFVTKGATRLLTADDIAGGIRNYLGALGNLEIGFRDWITARAPDEGERKFFRIAHDSAVFELFRTAFDEGKKPMRLTVTVFPADRNQFIVDVGDVPEPQYEAGAEDPRATAVASVMPGSSDPDESGVPVLINQFRSPRLPWSWIRKVLYLVFAAVMLWMHATGHDGWLADRIPFLGGRTIGWWIIKALKIWMPDP